MLVGAASAGVVVRTEGAAADVAGAPLLIRVMMSETRNMTSVCQYQYMSRSVCAVLASVMISVHMSSDLIQYTSEHVVDVLWCLTDRNDVY